MESKHTSGITGWTPTTKILISALMLVLGGLAFYFFRVVFVPLIIGAILAYILAPLVEVVCTKLRLPRTLATALIYLILLAVLVPGPAWLISWGIPQLDILQQEFVEFLLYLDTISADTIPIFNYEIVVGDVVQEVTNKLLEVVTSLSLQSVEIVLGAAETLLMVIFTLLIGFYLTRDARHFIAWFKGLSPPGYQDDINRLLEEINKIWSAFFRGQVILAFVVGIILTTIGFIIGLPQPIVLGVLGGLLEFLPSVGHAIWLVTASILALLEGSSTIPVSNWIFLLIVIGVHVAYTQFDLNYLIPRIIGRQVHLHPMVVILGIIIGAQVGGILGIALAAPTIASLRIVGRYIYARLFDLDPFPMVGAPTEPKSLRQKQLRKMREEDKKRADTGPLKDILSKRTNKK